jgi:hypothetical protein
LLIPCSQELVGSNPTPRAIADCINALHDMSHRHLYVRLNSRKQIARHVEKLVPRGQTFRSGLKAFSLEVLPYSTDLLFAFVRHHVGPCVTTVGNSTARRYGDHQ